MFGKLSCQVVTILANLSVLEQCASEVMQEQGITFFDVVVNASLHGLLRQINKCLSRRNRAATAAAGGETFLLQSIRGRRLRARSAESSRHAGPTEQR